MSNISPRVICVLNLLAVIVVLVKVRLSCFEAGTSEQFDGDCYKHNGMCDLRRHVHVAHVLLIP
jgi:hypothetical protein